MQATCDWARAEPSLFELCRAWALSVERSFTNLPFTGLGRSAMRSAVFFEGPLYWVKSEEWKRSFMNICELCQKIRFSYTYETRRRVILKIYSCKHASKQIKKPEFKSVDCYISLIYIGVTRRVASFVFLLSYLCTVKTDKLAKICAPTRENLRAN